jgi:hypothetical protein
MLVHGGAVKCVAPVFLPSDRDRPPKLSFVCFDRKPPYAKGHERRDGPQPAARVAKKDRETFASRPGRLAVKLVNRLRSTPIVGSACRPVKVPPSHPSSPEAALWTYSGWRCRWNNSRCSRQSDPFRRLSISIRFRTFVSSAMPPRWHQVRRSLCQAAGVLADPAWSSLRRTLTCSGRVIPNSTAN